MSRLFSFRSLLLLVLAIATSGCNVVEILAPSAAPPEADPWDEMLEAVNEVRAEARTCGDEQFPAVAPLAWDGQLEDAAYRHSRDMSRHEHFSHTGTDGSRVGDRVDRAGYDWRSVGENIARTHPSVEVVVAAWARSEGHCRTLMDSRYTELGAALVDGYWTQVFGRPY